MYQAFRCSPLRPLAGMEIRGPGANQKSGLLALCLIDAFPDPDLTDQLTLPFVDPAFALTHNVPRLFWDLWLEQNADSALVRNGLIFAHKQAASVTDQLRDHEDLTCGLEPLTPTPSGNPWEPPPKAVDPRVRSLSRGQQVTTASKD